jgi:hypothetical protein
MAAGATPASRIVTAAPVSLATCYNAPSAAVARAHFPLLREVPNAVTVVASAQGRR